jgi:hypothetical protein
VHRYAADKISGSLPCRISEAENCNEKVEEFLSRCHYHAGLYDDADDFKVGAVHVVKPAVTHSLEAPGDPTLEAIK